MGEWTFFSNYGHVLVCLERNNRARLKDVAEAVGITERAVQKIVKDLEKAGYITIRKQGRCNRYRINRRKSLRHGLESHVTVSRLLALVAPAGRAATAPATGEAGKETAEWPRDVATPVAAEPAPVTVPDPGPVHDPEVQESVPANETAVALQPEPEPEPKRESRSGEKEKSRSNKREKASEPLDVEQQGSLF